MQNCTKNSSNGEKCGIAHSTSKHFFLNFDSISELEIP